MLGGYKKIKIFMSFFFSMLSVTYACNSGGIKTKKEDEKTNIQDISVNIVRKSPNFNGDSAYRFVDKQVAFGPRIPGTKSHAECAEYLENKLKRFGAKVLIQKSSVITHDNRKYELKNIIASFNIEKSDRVLVTAHWDARPISDQDEIKASFDAANDGGSGVAVILEMARQIQQQKPTIGVDFILWDLEDYGKSDDLTPNESTWCLGSQYWFKNPHIKNYKARFAVNLDMVGGVGAQFTQDQVSVQYAPKIVDKIWNIANELGYSDYFPNKQSGSIIDDHFWINQYGIPCVDIIDFSNEKGFYPYWHTQKDDMNGIDKNVLRAVGQVILETVYRER